MSSIFERTGAALLLHVTSISIALLQPLFPFQIISIFISFIETMRRNNWLVPRGRRTTELRSENYSDPFSALTTQNIQAYCNQLCKIFSCKSAFPQYSFVDKSFYVHVTFAG